MFGLKKDTANKSPIWTGAQTRLLGGKSSRRVRPDGMDLGILCVTAFLLCLGVLMVYSATISFSDSPKYHTAPYHFLIRQIINVVIGLIAGFAVYRTPMRVWMRIAPYLAGVAIFLLIIVLIPGIGRSVNGARRWIALGPMNFQVTEFVKFAVLIGAAAFTVKRQEYMHSVTKGLAPMFIIIAVISGLIGVQPDLGATAVIIAIAMGVLFLGGLDGKIFTAVLILAIAIGFSMIYLSPWRLERMISYWDVWGNAYGKGYQLSHSLIAFGRGEWFGVGLGSSIEKLHYLPESHTDFIMAVIGEELGFVGVVVVVVAFYFFVRRAFAIGRQSIKLDRVFPGLVAEGVGIWIGFQAIINLGVATGMFPTKGLTLPFVSYGGSSLIATIAAVALLLRVDRENRILMRGGRV